MADKRVLVLRNNTLFIAAVLSFLSEQLNLDVLGIALEDEEFTAKTRAFRPEVVVLAAEPSEPWEGQFLSTILQSFPGVPVVALNENTNDIRTYREQRVIGATAADMLDIIAGTVPSN